VRIALLLLCLLPAACRKGVHAGSKVALAYTLTVDGRIYEASDAGQPEEIVIGAGQACPGLEAGIMGMTPGQEKTLTVPPDQGYGLHDPTAIQQIPLKAFGDLAKDLAVGRAVQGVRGGKPTEAMIVAMDEKSVTLDFNHRLAGKTLVYKVKVVSLGDAR
jgi:peptidylprolyl isomerase